MKRTLEGRRIAAVKNGAVFVALAVLWHTGGGAPAGFWSDGIRGMTAGSMALAAERMGAMVGSRQAWQKIVEQANEEGRVTIVGPPNEGLRSTLAEGFRKAYPDIALDYQVGTLSQMATKLRAELSAGKTSVDLSLRGASGVMRAKDLLDPLPPLLLPEAVDPAKWRSSQGPGLKWVDAEQQFVLQVSEWIFGYVMINSRVVKPGTLTKWSDLLRPEWRGKIASHDPRGGGPGRGVATYLALKLGEKFIVDLFKGQEVALTRSYHQVADWVAQQKYAVGLAQVADRIEAMKKEKIPVAVMSLADAPGYMTGGFGTVSVLKGAPHPNAAIVFLNWVISREGQDSFHRPLLSPSLRTDFSNDFVPDYLMPKRGVEYVDGYTEDYILNKEPKLAARVEELIGR